MTIVLRNVVARLKSLLKKAFLSKEGILAVIVSTVALAFFGAFGVKFAERCWDEYQSSQNIDIVPVELGKFKDYELGELIVSFIPEADQMPFNSWSGPPSIKLMWVTDGIEGEDQGYAYRIAQARVHVLGQRAYRLGKKVAELGWIVEYQTSGPSKLGVESILFYPGTPDKECFSSEVDSNCTFSPVESLRRRGAAIRELCQTDLCNGDNCVVIYEIGLPGRITSYIMHTDNAGTGGSNSRSELIVDNSRIELLASRKSEKCSQVVNAHMNFEDLGK